MSYTALNYYVLVIVLLVIYQIMPTRLRWMILLVGSGIFYWKIADNTSSYLLLISSIGFSYLTALGLLKIRRVRVRKIWLGSGLILSILPLLAVKVIDFMPDGTSLLQTDWIAPIGLSFYSLQMVAYLVDCYRGKINVQKNIGKYALFISWFPQILQGPIPRYEQLGVQLFSGKRAGIREIVRGIELIIWGFFLKLMIADKAAIIVDTVFDHHAMYGGFTILVAGIMYSIQLYTDFLACTTFAQGVSQLFGIRIVDNFDHPYFATSIQDFWRRWHISLSTWLRDYIYIPLGGNRKGNLRKYIHLLITFGVSGLWHGEGIKYLVWGLIHGCYQITGTLTGNLRKKVYDILLIPQQSFLWRILKTGGTCFWVMLAWIIFRAKTLTIGIEMIRSMFQTYNPWIFFRTEGDSIYQLGLSMQEWSVLTDSILILIAVSYMQQKMCIRDWVEKQHLLIRWIVYITAIVVIAVFGTYGYGFKAQDFIYGDF